MRSILRNIILAPAIMAAAALATNTATAETLVKVPFSFTAAGKTCPAGLYSVQRDRFGTLVTLQSKDGSRSFTWIVMPGDPSPTATGVVLRFDEQGLSHTLQSVQYGTMITARLDKKHKAKEYVPTRIVLGQ